MERLIPHGGIEPDTIQNEVAQALGLYITNAGLESGLGCSAAIGIMGMIQDAMDAGDLAVIKEKVREDAVSYNKWVEEHWPHFKRKTVLRV